MTPADLSRYLPRFSVLLAGRIAGAFAIFVVNILIARLLGIEALGRFAIFASLVAILTICLPLGYNSVAAIFSAEYSATGKSALLRGYVSWALKTIGGTAITLVTAWTFFYYLTPQYLTGDNYFLGIMVVTTAVATSILNLNSAIMTGQKRQVVGLLPEILLRPALLLTGVYALLATSSQIDINTILAVVAVASWTVLLIFVARGQSLTGLLRGPVAETDTRRWNRAAHPWLATSLLWDYSVDLLLVLASLLLGAVEIAILHICFRYRVLAGFGMRTINTLAMPEITESKVNANRAEMERRISLTNFASLGYAIFVLMLFWVLGDRLLVLFSEGIAQNTPALLMISLTMVIRAALGPAPLILAIHNLHTVTTMISAVGLIIAAVIILMFFQSLGVMAVAVGYTASNLVVSFSLWIYAKRKIGIDCSVFSGSPFWAMKTV